MKRQTIQQISIEFRANLNQYQMCVIHRNLPQYALFTRESEVVAYTQLLNPQSVLFMNMGWGGATLQQDLENLGIEVRKD